MSNNNLTDTIDTLDTATTSATDPIKEANQVAAYLKSHPAFFQEHEELLLDLYIPHNCSPARSLIEYKVNQLEQKVSTLKAQLNTLILIAQENSALYQQLHQFTLALLASRNLIQVLTTIQTHFKQQFHADAVNIYLIQDIVLPAPPLTPTDEYTAYYTDARSLDTHFQALLSQQQPVCGRLRTEQQAFLFKSQADHVQSSALIPLTHSQQSCFGLLAIGSYDAQRFQPCKETTFLAQIGAIMSQALAQQLFCAAMPTTIATSTEHG